MAGVLLLTACGSDGSDGSGGSSGSGGGDAAAQLFPDDFKGVCSGATQSGATDYETATAHKALYFETYEEDLVDQSTQLPTDWTVTFDPGTDALAAVDVVACAVRTSEELAQTCDGYEDDESGTSGSVNWYTGTYELTVYAAHGGEELGSTTLDASDDQCPLIATFDEGETEVDMYASPSDEDVTGFLKQFVQP